MKKASCTVFDECISTDECLSRKGGHLFIEDCDTVELAKQFGSPSFVISENQLRRNIKRFQTIFSEHWPGKSVQVLPAIKCNWISTLNHILAEEGAGADVYSEGELLGALNAGIAPEMISVNGGGKTEAHLRNCIKAGVRITVEDLDEPDLIEQIAGELGRVAKVRLRVKPNFPNLWKPTDFALEKVPIDLGLQIYKSGIPEQYLEELGKKVIQMKNVELTGLHFHGGRHSESLWYWRGMMKKYGQLIVKLTKAWGNYTLEEIDIGGGFASRRDPHSKLNVRADVLETWFLWPAMQAARLLGDTLRYKLFSILFRTAFVKKASKKRAPSIREYAETAVSTLVNELNKGKVDITNTVLQLEPGRSLYTDTGIHLTKVKKVKKQTQPMKLDWLLTDTSYFFLTGGVYEYNFHEFRMANKMDAPLSGVADIVGHSCFGDRMLPFVKIPETDPGDLIAMLDAGCLLEVSASNFNALPRPVVILVNGENSEVIKRAETLDDIYSRDVVSKRFKKIVPERLKQTETGVAGQ